MATYWPPAVSKAIPSGYQVIWGKGSSKSLLTKYLRKEFKSEPLAVSFAKTKAKSLGYDHIEVYKGNSTKAQRVSIGNPKSLKISKGRCRISPKMPKLR